MNRALINRGGAKETRLAQAQVIKAIETTWRYWQAFIAEQQDELAQRTATMTGDDILGPSAPQPRKARLPQPVRQELGQVLEARRQAAQRHADESARQGGTPAPDREQVMKDLLDRIQAELSGEALVSKKALVWFDGQLIEFDHRIVAAQGTTDADYMSYSSTASRKRRQMYSMLGVAGAAVLLIIVVVGMRASGGSAGPATLAKPQAEIGQQPVALWDAHSMEIDGQRATINGASVGYPLLLCVPESLKERIKPGSAFTIRGPSNVRIYRLHADAATTPRDAVVANCTQSPPQMLYSAEISAAQTSEPLDASRVRSVDVWSPETNPGVIPPDHMQVDVHAVGTDVAQATLILADGRRWSATSSSEEPGGLLLSYLVPLAKTEQIAGWEVRSGSDLPGLLSLTLPAPRSRASVLRQQLQVEAGPPTIVERDGQATLVLTLTLRLDAPEPLKLLPTDLVVARPNEAPLSTVQWTPPTVQPDAASTVMVAVPLVNRQPPFDIALANWRARFRW